MIILTRALIAFHRDYLRAMRQPHDARLKGLVSYCLLAEKRQAEAEAASEKTAGVMLAQAGYLKKVVEAGQRDMVRIMGDFDKDDADRPALLEQAQAIQEAVGQAVTMLKTIQAGFSQAK